MLNSRCGHFTGKHHFRISRFTPRGAAMRCQWTLCQKSIFVSNDYVRAMVAR